MTRAEDFVWRAWPAAGVDAAYVVRGTSGNLSGQVVRLALLPGDPVTAERLVAPGSRGRLAAVTAPGMRAASVALSPAAGVSGLVEPGDRVDVILTQTVGSAGSERRGATTVIDDARVVAVDAGRERGNEGGTASLEVTPRQAEMLALAGEMGKVSLSLRSLAAGPSRPPRTMTLDHELSRLRGAPAAAMAATAPALALTPPLAPTASGRSISLFHGSTTETRAVPR